MKRNRAGTAGTSALVVMLLYWGVACGDRPAPARSNDTASPTLPPPPPPDSAPAIVESPWDANVGPVLLVVGENGSQGSVVLPFVAPDASLDTTHLDAAPYQGTQFDLLSNGRVVAKASLSAVLATDIPDDCSAWPRVQLTAGSDTLSREWVVAFEAGRVTPIAFDSLAGLPSRDSSQLAIQLARVASSVPGDTVPELKGIPYQVRRAYRFTISPGVEGVLAEVLRTLNQEANPKQEHILLIAERDSTDGGRFRMAYSERTSGGEEMLETSELLTVARVGASGRVTLVIARYLGDGVIYSLLERTAPHEWRLRWSSPYAGC